MSRHNQREYGQVLGIGTGYSVMDVARYLQFSPESIVYWLRTGNLLGERDPRSGEWRVMPQNLVAFLRNTAEPMPAGLSDVIPVVAEAQMPASATTQPAIATATSEIDVRPAAAQRERTLVPAL